MLSFHLESIARKLDGECPVPCQSTKTPQIDTTALLSEIPKVIFSADGSATHRRRSPTGHTLSNREELVLYSQTLRKTKP
jgi:hypothetical protein